MKEIDKDELSSVSKELSEWTIQNKDFLKKIKIADDSLKLKTMKTPCEHDTKDIHYFVYGKLEGKIKEDVINQIDTCLYCSYVFSDMALERSEEKKRQKLHDRLYISPEEKAFNYLIKKFNISDSLNISKFIFYVTLIISFFTPTVLLTLVFSAIILPLLSSLNYLNYIWKKPHSKRFEDLNRNIGKSTFLLSSITFFFISIVSTFNFPYEAIKEMYGIKEFGFRFIDILLLETPISEKIPIEYRLFFYIFQILFLVEVLSSLVKFADILSNKIKNRGIEYYISEVIYWKTKSSLKKNLFADIGIDSFIISFTNAILELLIVHIVVFSSLHLIGFIAIKMVSILQLNLVVLREILILSITFIFVLAIFIFLFRSLKQSNLKLSEIQNKHISEENLVL
jgi:hypothetical protein